jgi:aminoglycoside 6-adenylyltransferase
MLSTLPTEAQVLARLIAWGEAEPALRAMLMTSSRARPDNSADALSDYDIIAVLTEPEPFRQDEAWHAFYGTPLVRWGDEDVLDGARTSFCGVIYADFVKIDYTLWPVALLDRITARGVLPAELDAGYRVLLDKDGHTRGWPAPTYRAYLPAVPSAADYQDLVEDFWWAASYVAKSLWRDELVFARWCLDNEIQAGVLRRLLEWRVALDKGWSLRPGVKGRGLKQRLPAALWAELAATYVGPELHDNWDALFRTVALFRRVALEVGADLGHTYPQAIDDRMSAYLQAVSQLPLNRPPA